MLLHGGGQTRGAWGAAARRLGELGYRAVALDARGHGESDWSAGGIYSLEAFANDLRVLTQQLDGPPLIIGASLGGITALVAAGEEPRIASEGLVLVDVAHRPDPKGIERIVGFMTAHPEGFASLDDAADAVAAYQPHRTRRDTSGLQRNLRRNGDRWVWHWDPRLLQGLAGDMTPANAPDRFLTAARNAGVPILLVRGGVSDVIDAEITDEFTRAIPRAQAVTVDQAGHMVAGDRNDHFVDAILPFVTRTCPAA